MNSDRRVVQVRTSASASDFWARERMSRDILSDFRVRVISQEQPRILTPYGCQGPPFMRPDPRRDFGPHADLNPLLDRDLNADLRPKCKPKLNPIFPPPRCDSPTAARPTNAQTIERKVFGAALREAENAHADVHKLRRQNTKLENQVLRLLNINAMLAREMAQQARNVS